MIFLIGVSLIIVGIGIVLFMVWYQRESENMSEFETSSSKYSVLIEIFSALLGSSFILLPLGLILLGVVILIYR